MKIVRTLALGAVLSAAFVTTAAAQQPAGAPPQGQGQGGGRGQGNMALRGIELTDAQKAQVDSIRTKYRALMPAFTPGEQPDSATRAKMMDLRTKQNDEIRALLNDDQKKVFDQNLADQRARMGGGRPNPTH
jgi:Spy/CpxP family protein refolding chaperone